MKLFKPFLIWLAQFAESAQIDALNATLAVVLREGNAQIDALNTEIAVARRERNEWAEAAAADRARVAEFRLTAKFDPARVDNSVVRCLRSALAEEVENSQAWKDIALAAGDELARVAYAIPIVELP